MYAKVGATSTSIHLNKPSMQHSPTHWNSKNYEKWPENASKSLFFKIFLPRCSCHNVLKSRPPPFQFLCTPMLRKLGLMHSLIFAPPLKVLRGGAKIAQGGAKNRARFARGIGFLKSCPPLSSRVWPPLTSFPFCRINIKKRCKMLSY